jgi:Uma2 family endonuclease
MPSPVKLEGHGEEQGALITWMGNYSWHTPGVRFGDNTSVQLDLDNEPQPDGLLLIDPKKRGRAKISKKGFVVGAPELVAEVAATSASYDLNVKLHVYRRNGVQEYVVWRTRDREVDWFTLRQGSFGPLRLSSKGIYKSEVMPGLWLDPVALIRGEYAKVDRILRQGLKSREHAAFVARLKQS